MLTINSTSKQAYSAVAKSHPLVDKLSEGPEKTKQLHSVLIEKLAIYFAKMGVHDYEMAVQPPSLVAVGALYVCLKVIEHMKKLSLINKELVLKLVVASKYSE